MKDFVESLADRLPDPLFRSDNRLREWCGISPGTLRDLGRKGRGPRQIRIGRKVAYRREDFLEWLRNRVVEE